MQKLKSWRCACHLFHLRQELSISSCLKDKPCRWRTNSLLKKICFLQFCRNWLTHPIFSWQAGELIAKLDLDDPSAVRKAKPFRGSFPRLGLPTAISGKVHQRCAATLNAARMILAGYDHKVDEVNAIWFSYVIQLFY